MSILDSSRKGGSTELIMSALVGGILSGHITIVRVTVAGVYECIEARRDDGTTVVKFTESSRAELVGRADLLPTMVAFPYHEAQRLERIAGVMGQYKQELK